LPKQLPDRLSKCVTRRYLSLACLRKDPGSPETTVACRSPTTTIESCRGSQCVCPGGCFNPICAVVQTRGGAPPHTSLDPWSDTAWDATLSSCSRAHAGRAALNNAALLHLHEAHALYVRSAARLIARVSPSDGADASRQTPRRNASRRVMSALSTSRKQRL
jgi:hypothetical protein